ncbi:MAG TPA: 50S ribosomal protein L6 [Limnochordia bacterium]|nr:50S ribosomal protein L6 [Limnochordia bacterium]
MSRIGKMPVEIPDGVEVTIQDHTIKVKGPKGELTRKIHEAIQVRVEDGQIVVTRSSDEKFHKSLHGLTRTLIANMVEGVTKGYERTLEIRGVGYRASKQGNKLVLNVGYSHPVEVEAPPGIEFEVPQPTQIIVRGIDKELVGEVAANVRAVRKPEPYLGKGIMYAGERIIRKAGKAGKVSK